MWTNKCKWTWNLSKIELSETGEKNAQNSKWIENSRAFMWNFRRFFSKQIYDSTFFLHLSGRPMNLRSNKKQTFSFRDAAFTRGWKIKIISLLPNEKKPHFKMKEQHTVDSPFYGWDVCVFLVIKAIVFCSFWFSISFHHKHGSPYLPSLYLPHLLLHLQKVP